MGELEDLVNMIVAVLFCAVAGSDSEQFGVTEIARDPWWLAENLRFWLRDCDVPG
jgi:hypothetical protein